MNVTTIMRVRTRLADKAMEDRKGKLPGDQDYDLLLTGPTRIDKLDGRPLCVFLPGAVTEALNGDGVYDVLHELRTKISRNRGMASGTKRFRSQQTRSYTKPIASAVIGAMDPGGQLRYCRLTSWTGRNLPKWETLHPVLREISSHLEEHVPDRYTAQWKEVRRTDPAWVVPGTPFTTITVNNSYPTGVHTDKGDLDAGFSTIAVLRQGTYSGGRLVFPQYRIAADLGHGDLILMDAHEYHGNTQLWCACNVPMNGACELCGAERISIVSYFRTKLTECGSPEEEHDKATAYALHAEQAATRRLTGAT